MDFGVWAVVIIGGLFGAMLALQAFGRSLAGPADPDGKEKSGSNASRGAVFGLLGLLVGFTFSGAAGRLDERRHLVVEETNDIGTAYLRVDVLPQEMQAAVRDLYRQYVDTRINIYKLVPDMDAVRAEQAKMVDLQNRIWKASVDGASRSNSLVVVLQAVNAMIDITSTREAATRIHPPIVVFVMLGVLTLVASLFIGYDMAAATKVSWIHRYGFAIVMTVALFVIVNLEYPRLGFVNLEPIDRIMVDLRASMK